MNLLPKNPRELCKVIISLCLTVLIILVLMSTPIGCSSVQKMSDDVERNAFAKAVKDSTGKTETKTTDFGTIDTETFSLKYTPSDSSKPIRIDNGRDTIVLYNTTVEKHYITQKEQKKTTENKKEESSKNEATESKEDFTQNTDTKEKTGMNVIAIIAGIGALLIITLFLIALFFINKKFNQLKTVV